VSIARAWYEAIKKKKGRDWKKGAIGSRRGLSRSKKSDAGESSTKVEKTKEKHVREVLIWSCSQEGGIVKLSEKNPVSGVV